MQARSRAFILVFLVMALTFIIIVPATVSQEPDRSDAVGTAFTYQGFLKSGDQIADGSYDFTFKLFDALSVGAQVGSTLIVDDVAVTQGYFTVELAFGDVFDGRALWLEVAVSPDKASTPYSDLSPRQALSPTPYANYASRSAWAGIADVPEELANGDDDTLAALSCSAGQIAVWGGAAWMCGDGDDTLSGLSCNPGEIAKWSGSAWACRPDDDSLAALSCGNGQIAEWNGSAWVCGTDDVGAGGGGGDVTGVYGGDGLLGGGPSGEITLTVAFAGTGSAAAVARSDHDHNSLYAEVVHGHDNLYFTETELETGGSGAAVHWQNLTSVPADLADGDDNTDTLADLSCGSGEVAKWNGSTWVCGLDEDNIDDTVSFDEIAAIVGTAANTVAAGDHNHSGVYAEAVHGHDDVYYTETELATGGSGAVVHWGNLTSVPADLADGDDNSDTLADLSCGAGEVAKWNGANWVCEEDMSGWSLTGNAGTSPGVNFLGTTDNVSLTLSVSGTAALRLEPTSWTVNVIGGSTANEVQDGVYGASIGGGGSTIEWNQISEHFATIGGGTDNTVGDSDGDLLDGRYGTVSGGAANTASGLAATVGGGVGNTASNVDATVAGGFTNTSSGYQSFIGGGISNVASNFQSTVVGGVQNMALGTGAAIGGGSYNRVITTTDRATIAGGGFNVISGTYSAIGGGHYNYAGADYATIGGGGPVDPISGATTTNNRVTDDYGTIGGGGQNQAGDGDSDATDATFATVGGGLGNTASGTTATVGGGQANTAGANIDTIAGGWLNNTSGAGDAIGGGFLNIITSTYGTIAGGSSNFVSGDFGAVAGGYGNEAAADYASVGGGFNNRANVAYATISGGGPSDPVSGSLTTNNRVTDDYGTIGGGGDNQAGNDVGDAGDASFATVGGGLSNTASGTTATVGGGQGNTAGANIDTIAGGWLNNTSGAGDAIGGGYFNYVTSLYGTIAGGSSNFVSGDFGAVAGGYGNQAVADYATVGGGFNNRANVEYATISGGGPSDPVSGPLTTNNRVTDDYGTIGGGGDNQAGDDAGDTIDASYATVGGGLGNTAAGTTATVGGGQGNTAGANIDTIAGGWLNNTSGAGDAVGGGYFNYVTSLYGTIAGGSSNYVSGDFGAVAGGYGNQATAGYATVPGGYLNDADGAYSFAAGRRAKAGHEASFVWADNSTDADFSSDRDNQFKVRAYGGVYLDDAVGNTVEINGFTNQIDSSTGAYLSYAGVWTNTSDRNAKENFAAVDGQQILDQLAGVPISTWNYIVEDEAIKHIGPMAQEFYAAFGLGDSELAIGTVDADGVSLAAVQALYNRSLALEGENAELKQQLYELEGRLTHLENREDGSPFTLAILPAVIAVTLAGLLWIALKSRRFVGRILGGGQ